MVLVLGSGAFADSLFPKDTELAGHLVSDRDLDFKEGDIIVVLVQENIDASTESNTNTKKEASTESEALQAANSFFVNPKPNGLGLVDPEVLPNWEIELENEHRTTGKTKRTNQLITTVSCVVTKTYENGNLDIEGERLVTVNREESRLHVSGMIRSKDVTPSNTVRSSQMANGRIELRGRGPLWNNQRRGIITRILDWFSPY
jgi:flagellar L-ring protein precursor FlgH